MDILIPTYGRFRAQSTYSELALAGLHKRAKLVVQEREAHLYANFPTVILPPHITTIAPTRQWILDRVGEHDKFVMLDDDLAFYARRQDDKTKFRPAMPEDLHHMFELMEHELTNAPHIGIAAREGANRNTEPFLFNTRIMRVLAYRRSTIKAHNLRFDGMEVMEDFDMALWLLRCGHKNIVLNNYCQNQSGSGKAGGCSHFRTPELHAHNAQLLQMRHPKYVKLVQKTTKGAWGGGTRTDVHIQWKRAYDDGKSGI